MKKIINFFKMIKENLNDPKKKAITLLGIYFLFFLFVFLILKSIDTVPYKEDVKVQDNDSNIISSYEYKYKLNDNNILYEIEGTHKDDMDVFNYNDERYYMQNGRIYLFGSDDEEIKMESFAFDFQSYDYLKVEELLQNSKFIVKTTYEDNSEDITYTINAKDYFKLQNLGCDLDKSDLNLTISVNFNKYINKVEIDLSSYYDRIYKIEVNYIHVNEIKKISILSE